MNNKKKFNKHKLNYKGPNNKRLFEEGPRISFRELKPYTHIAAWVTNDRSYLSHFCVILDRITNLINKNGWCFTFLYLKKALHQVVTFVSKSDNHHYTTAPFGTMVRVDKNGLPAILPRDIRTFLVSLREREMIIGFEDLRRAVGLTTLLSCYRLFKFKTEVDLTSVTEAFKGTSESFPDAQLKLSLDDLNLPSLVNLGSSILQGESSGPNNKRSAWGAEIDALAFIHHPKLLRSIMLGFLKSKSVLMLIWFTIIFILGLPYYLFSLLLGAKRANVCKLGVVYRAAGKARVIGITNYWIQVLFKPLHDQIFKALKLIPQDGTLNQEEPLRLLFKRLERSTTYHCFDLSAATDRLPLTLQADILRLLNIPYWKEWMYLMRSPFHHGSDDIIYSVGQPMGAYSSWAMLALTHHTIIRFCALRCGLKEFADYCVLGDDVIIANNDVAKEYELNMKVLGVKINRSKSIVSSTLVEFAKRWKIIPCAKDYSYRFEANDIRSLGPGLILQSIRSRILIFDLFREVVARNLYSYSYIIQRLSDLPKCIKRKASYIFWEHDIKLIKVRFNISPDVYSTIDELYIKITEYFRSYSLTIRHTKISETFSILFNANLKRFDYDLLWKFNSVVKASISKERQGLVKDLKFLLLNSIKFSQMRLGLPYLFDVILWPIKPAVYISFRTLLRSWLDLRKKERARQLLVLCWIMDYPLTFERQVGILYLFHALDKCNISALSFNRHELVRRDSEFIKVLRNAFTAEGFSEIDYFDEATAGEGF